MPLSVFPQRERLEWHQFQCDLQVAVSVADRLRTESEQALGLLQESHRSMEEELAQAHHRQQETGRELDRLKAEHRDVCKKLTELSLQQQQEQAELDAPRNAHQVRDITGCDQQTERQDSEERNEMQQEEKLKEVETGTEVKNVDAQKKENQTNEEVHRDPEETNGSDSMQLTGKGVAEGYLRSLVALEKKKEKQKNPKRIEMLSERSW